MSAALATVGLVLLAAVIWTAFEYGLAKVLGYSLGLKVTLFAGACAGTCMVALGLAKAFWG